MLGVKITILLIIITVIYRYIVNSLVSQESWDKKVEMAFGTKYPAYVYPLGILVVLDALGIVYSAVWFLFLR